MGKTPYRAAMDAADEIGLAVISTSFTIVAVFVPVSFMGGHPGAVFQAVRPDRRHCRAVLAAGRASHHAADGRLSHARPRRPSCRGPTTTAGSCAPISRFVKPRLDAAALPDAADRLRHASPSRCYFMFQHPRRSFIPPEDVSSRIAVSVGAAARRDAGRHRRRQRQDDAAAHRAEVDGVQERVRARRRLAHGARRTFSRASVTVILDPLDSLARAQACRSRRAAGAADRRDGPRACRRTAASARNRRSRPRSSPASPRRPRCARPTSSTTAARATSPIRSSRSSDAGPERRIGRARGGA